jgi:transposase-like protein
MSEPRTRTIRAGTWEEMRRELLEQVLQEEGSIRKAAKVLGVPRSTLGAWARSLGSPRVVG